MLLQKHWAIFISNTANKKAFVRELLGNTPPTELQELQYKKGALFSSLRLRQFIDEEDRHEIKTITANTTQSLRTMSSGEQKKALLKYLFRQAPEYLILDSPFDNLDTASQRELLLKLHNISNTVAIVQLLHRKEDLLSFTNCFFILERTHLKPYATIQQLLTDWNTAQHLTLIPTIPKAPNSNKYPHELLISFKNVSVSYGTKVVLQQINWDIRPGEFWQLIGKNGSGKTTLLSMITGDNSKGYGQELFIFGKKKGDGESIWDIKKQLGYFTPSMTTSFKGYHTVENMIISGLYDSVGLYTRPGDSQKKMAKAWLKLLQMWHLKDQYFHQLTDGQQRIIMTVRAMIKHPWLLILDEPTAGLDDHYTLLFISLVNRIAKESSTAIIFVSHRKEKELQADTIYELQANATGSLGCWHPA